MAVRRQRQPPGTQPAGGGLVLRLVTMLHISLALAYVALWLLVVGQGEAWRGDFTAYYTGWSLLRDGHGADLYDLDLQTRYQQAMLGDEHFKGGVLPYINPPHAALPFIPLAWLPRSAAYLVWTAGQGALLLWVVLLLRRIVLPWSPAERWALISGLLAFLPLFTTFLLGTFSLFMLVCALQVYRSLKDGHERRGGVWLALGTVKPQLLLMPGLLTLGARRWWAVGSAAGAMLLLLLVSLVYPGWQSWLGFVSIIGTINSSFDALGNVPADMYNLKGTLTLLLGNEQQSLINAISLGALAVVAAGVVLLWRGAWQPDEAGFDGRFGLTMLLGLLFSPHLHLHDCLLLLLPVLLFYSYLRQRNLPRRGYALFVLSWPLLFLLSNFVLDGALGVRLPVVAMAVLAAWMGWTLWREGDAA
jgi:hypothetical protein